MNHTHRREVQTLFVVLLVLLYNELCPLTYAFQLHCWHLIALIAIHIVHTCLCDMSSALPCAPHLESHAKLVVPHQSTQRTCSSGTHITPPIRDIEQTNPNTQAQLMAYDRKSKGTSAGDTGTQGMLSLFITFLYSYCQASTFLQFSPFPHLHLKNSSSQHYSTLPLPKHVLHAPTTQTHTPSPTSALAMPRPPHCWNYSRRSTSLFVSHSLIFLHCSAHTTPIRKNGYCIYGYKYLILIHNGPL
jgi:hypothetical protein